jgi:hypothetical protein
VSRRQEYNIRKTNEVEKKKKKEKKAKQKKEKMPSSSGLIYWASYNRCIFQLIQEA